jgi:hypothetical protein
MRTRDDIEADLVMLTSDLHNISLETTSAGNTNKMRILLDGINKTLDEADGFRPKLVSNGR